MVCSYLDLFNKVFQVLDDFIVLINKFISTLKTSAVKEVQTALDK